MKEQKSTKSQQMLRMFQNKLFNTYDMINEDFNYIIVTISIIVSIIGVFIAKKYAVKSSIHKLFENKEVVSAM